MRKYQFHFRLGFTIFWGFFFFLFCWLGVWQLHRYHDKKVLQKIYQERLLAAPRSLPEVMATHDLMFQHVKVTGKYLYADTMFVQDQFYQDKLGYEVLTPFQIASDKKILLVDRGWSSHVLSEKGEAQATLIGHLKLLNEYQFTLGNNVLRPNDKPLIMQKIAFDEISRLTHEQYYPFILRLDESMPGSLPHEWVITNVLPERHLGYAIQWFVMAFVLLIAYFCFCIERITHEKR